MKKDRKVLGKHDYSGECNPDNPVAGSFRTFSVGVFEWLPKSKSGLKKSKAKIRIRGYTSDPETVYALAERFCDMLDRGEDLPDKVFCASVTFVLQFLGGLKFMEGV